MTRTIEHALVMDTDHLRGGGGYAVVGVSPGASDAERVFVAQNFSISDYLHDPQNARVYFSVFRIPGGRTAFVRRFANGTRRNGVQNRLFVHTLFLDDATLQELRFLPWLLVDATPLTLDVAPLLADPAFPALPWNGRVTADHAFDELKMRFDQVSKRLEPAAVASVIDAIANRQRPVLPQGPVYEQLSLVAWSMLPPRDRADLAWTQHDSQNVAGVTFDIANAPDAASANLNARADTPARRVVALSTSSVAEWSAFQSETARLNLTVRESDLGSWLRFRDALESLIKDPVASDHELVPKLQELARAVRKDRRDPWVDELQILRFLWTTITRAIDAGQDREIAVTRWVSLFDRTDIGSVVFREPPPRDWLDASAREVGADLIVQSFIRGTEAVPGAAATREKIAAWLRDSGEIENISLKTMAQLVERLAIDRSPLQRFVLESAIARKNGLATLARTLPAKKSEIGDAVLLATILAIQARHEDASSFVRSMLLPQLAIAPSLGEKIPEAVAVSVADLLREAPEDFARLAAHLPAALAGRIAFDLAEAGEPAALWLGIVVGTADQFDATGDHARIQRFVSRVRSLASHASSIDRHAMQQVLVAFRRRVENEARVGPCMRELVLMTRSMWHNVAETLADLVETLIARSSVRAAEWESVVTELVAKHSGEPFTRLLTTFWERVNRGDLVALREDTIPLLQQLPRASRERVVSRWLEVARGLPDGRRAEEFLDELADITPSHLAAPLDAARSWREIDLGIADELTLMRLDDALLRSRPKERSGEMLEAIARILKDEHGVQRTTHLLRIAASDRTLPSTRRLIETKLLDRALRAVRADEWTRVLSDAGPELYRRGLILVSVGREIGASRSSAARSFESACRRNGRQDGIEAVAAGASAGTLSRLASSLFRGESSR